MFRLGKRSPIFAALLTSAALLGLAPPAGAGQFQIDYSIDGGPLVKAPGQVTVATASGSQVVWSDSNVGGLFSVALTFATSNSPGVAGTALVTQSNNSISTLYTSGTHSLSIYVSATGFASSPGSSPDILSTASSITENTGKASVAYTSYADTSNRLFGTSGPTVTSVLTSYSVAGNAGKGKQNSTMFSPHGATYSLTDRGQYELAAGTSITVVSGNAEVTPTPAPAGVVLVLSGMPLLVFGGWLRRRPAPKAGPTRTASQAP
jgi:hypothetical protein